MKYAAWIEVNDQFADDYERPTYSFKCVGELQDVQAAIAHVLLNGDVMDAEHVMAVTIEPMEGDQ